MRVLAAIVGALVGWLLVGGLGGFVALTVVVAVVGPLTYEAETIIGAGFGLAGVVGGAVLGWRMGRPRGERR